MPNPSKRRPVNLSLVALAFLCLAFPFTAVSCQTAMGSISAEFTGYDAAFGGAPTIEATEGMKEPKSAEDNGVSPQPLVILGIVVLALGIIPLSRSRANPVFGIGVGAVAGVLFAAGQLSMRSTVASALADDKDLKRTDPYDLIESRYGFWLVLLVTLGLAAYNVVALARARATAVPPPQTQPPPTP
ncbi:hypothetical protein ABZ816_37060 [Actinosynnema sp. NPDC047251]|nr:hypothetical protein [Saccharothrix espanaensis]